MQSIENPAEGFLADIFNGLRRRQARAQFELNQFAEIRDKVLLRPEISGAEALYIGFVKGLELQDLPAVVEKCQ